MNTTYVTVISYIRINNMHSVSQLSNKNIYIGLIKLKLRIMTFYLCILVDYNIYTLQEHVFLMITVKKKIRFFVYSRGM